MSPDPCFKLWRTCLCYRHKLDNFSVDFSSRWDSILEVNTGVTLSERDTVLANCWWWGRAQTIILGRYFWKVHCVPNKLNQIPYISYHFSINKAHSLPEKISSFEASGRRGRALFEHLIETLPFTDENTCYLRVLPKVNGLVPGQAET